MDLVEQTKDARLGLWSEEHQKEGGYLLPIPFESRDCMRSNRGKASNKQNLEVG